MTPKKPNYFTVKRLFLFCLFSSIAVLLIPYYVKLSVRNNIFSQLEKVENKEFAIVLGAGIKKGGLPGSYLKKRLDDVLVLYKAGKIQKILVSGDNAFASHNEIAVMNNYLVAYGVPQNKIYGDYAGFNTYSTMHRADKVFDIKSAIIVTQGFHLPRAIYIAKHKGINATGFASKPSYGRRINFKREYLATIKAFYDCQINRKLEHYGQKVDTNEGSNIK